VSGHAHRAEQRRMIELVRPRAFVPAHGTRHHLDRHADLARELGVGNVLVMENGHVAEIDEAGIVPAGRVHAGRVHTFAGRAITKESLREREVLAEGGVVSCVALLDEGGVARDVRIVTRGVLDEEAERELLAAARREALSSLAALPSTPAPDDAAVADAVRLAVRRMLSRVLGYKPLTVVQVVRERPR
jgi:ribonuclease J